MVSLFCYMAPTVLQSSIDKLTVNKTNGTNVINGKFYLGDTAAKT